MFPGMPIRASSQSTMRLSAKEIYVLADASIQEIRNMRRELRKKALAHCERQVVRFGPLGIFSRPKYRTEDEAIRNAPEVQMANEMASTDMDVSNHMLKAAKYLMGANIPEEEKVMDVTLTDLMALLPL